MRWVGVVALLVAGEARGELCDVTPADVAERNLRDYTEAAKNPRNGVTAEKLASLAAIHTRARQTLDECLARRDTEIAEQQASQATRRQEHAARLDVVRNDPQTPAIIATAATLAFRELRRQALAEIADQKRYAKVGGVVNRHVIWQWQERIRYYDRGIKFHQAKAVLKKNDPKVAILFACFVQYPDEESGPCSEETVRIYTNDSSPMNLN